MKRLIRAIRRLFRSESDKRLDEIHAESRAENARMIAEGKGREGLQKNAKLLGLDTEGKSRPKMIFGRDPSDGE